MSVETGKNDTWSASEFWRRLEADAGAQKRGRAFFWVAAVAIHLALMTLFLIVIARPDKSVPEAVAIELVAPPMPTPTEPAPPKQEAVKEVPKVKLAAPKPLARPRLQIDTTHSAPAMVTELPAPPPSPAPSQAAPVAQIAPPPTFLNELYQRLARSKRYPRAAQFAHIEGTALLRFTMDRNGKVLSYKIERSAGSPILDQEVSAMIERAQPLPTLPPDMPDQIELVIPVQFSVK